MQPKGAENKETVPHWQLSTIHCSHLQTTPVREPTRASDTICSKEQSPPPTTSSLSPEAEKTPSRTAPDALNEGQRQTAHLPPSPTHVTRQKTCKLTPLHPHPSQKGKGKAPPPPPRPPPIAEEAPEEGDDPDFQKGPVLQDIRDTDMGAAISYLLLELEGVDTEPDILDDGKKGPWTIFTNADCAEQLYTLNTKHGDGAAALQAGQGGEALAQLFALRARVSNDIGPKGHCTCHGWRRAPSTRLKWRGLGRTAASAQRQKAWWLGPLPSAMGGRRTGHERSSQLVSFCSVYSLSHSRSHHGPRGTGPTSRRRALDCQLRALGAAPGNLFIARALLLFSVQVHARDAGHPLYCTPYDSCFRGRSRTASTSRHTPRPVQNPPTAPLPAAHHR
eukprot:scaffold6513_cov125-Isochrysis_galbana.AAC.5